MLIMALARYDANNCNSDVNLNCNLTREHKRRVRYCSSHTVAADMDIMCGCYGCYLHGMCWLCLAGSLCVSPSVNTRAVQQG